MESSGRAERALKREMRIVEGARGQVETEWVENSANERSETGTGRPRKWNGAEDKKSGWAKEPDSWNDDQEGAMERSLKKMEDLRELGAKEVVEEGPYYSAAATVDAGSSVPDAEGVNDEGGTEHSDGDPTNRVKDEKKEIQVAAPRYSEKIAQALEIEAGDVTCDLAGNISVVTRAVYGDSGTGGGESEDSSQGTEPVSRHARLFTDAELDALAEGKNWLDGGDPEEYEKELEDRLFPLDEDKVQARIRGNANGIRKPELKDMSAVLGIPVEVLERNKDVWSGPLSTPEYWLDWYAETLDSSHVAKRANRDFRSYKKEGDEALPGRGAAVSAVSGKASRSENLPEGINEENYNDEDPFAVEEMVLENVGVELTEIDLPRRRCEGGRTIPFRWRSKIRRCVYGVLRKEFADYEKSAGDQGELEERAALGEVLPARDKTTESSFDESAVRTRLVEMMGTHDETLLDDAMVWARQYFEQEATIIWAKFLRRWERSAGFDGSIGTAIKAPEVTVTSEASPSNSESHESYSVEESPESYQMRPLKAPKSTRPPNLVGVRGEGAREGEECVTPEGRRVICCVSGIQALSDGFIDSCPSEMLADTGAIASLVHQRVLKRLGRAGEELRPYARSLDSVSGHRILVRGVIDLPVTLGTLDKGLPFVVVNHLPGDAILGTDSLRAFRAVIDVEEATMTLKETGEVLPLGDARVEETHVASVASSILLKPGRQALVRTMVKGDVKNHAVVLVEGVPGWTRRYVSPGLCDLCRRDKCWLKRATPQPKTLKFREALR